ncbi:MAG: hypothetical protein WBM86_09070, partial [Waterburya sp.]
MNYLDQDSDYNFEEMRTFLIGDEKEAEKASMSTIPFGLEELQEVPYYKRPFIQLLTVVGIGLPIILLVMAAFKGGSRPSIAQATPQMDQEKAKLVSALNEERERIRQLELQNALYEQKMDVIVTEPKAKPKTTAKPKPAPVQKVATTPAPKPVVAQRNPQPVYQPPAPRPQVRTAPAPKPQPVAKPLPKPDPM